MKNMKKIFALLLAFALVFGLMACTDTGKSEDPKPVESQSEDDSKGGEKEIIQVDYYCSIGAYLAKLQELVDEYNAGQGKEDGVYINIISNINSYTTDLRALMQAGTHYDLIDAGTTNADYFQQGWLQDLSTIDDPELKALIDSYAAYTREGFNKQYGILFSLPLEVVPIKMAVNTDLFEKNNLELPKTWDDVVEAARVITENGNGEEFGFGWSTWTATWRRFLMKGCTMSTGRIHWDPNTETYDFAPFKEQIEAVKKMYDNDWMIGADDLKIDPIRAKFADGVVGMFPAPAYDYAVYTTQFPAQCNWTVIDMPLTSAEDAGDYMGTYMERVGASIDAVNYAAASDAKKAAMVKALCFINGDYVNSEVYKIGGMIPYKREIMEETELSADLGPQFALFADLTNYSFVAPFPDSLITLEGDNFATVFAGYLTGDVKDLDAAIADLNTRYNDAYKKLKEAGDVDLSMYAFEYSLKK